MGFGQVNEGLNPEERAYLFHIVKKSPILNNNFGRYFDYQGPDRADYRIHRHYAGYYQTKDR